jgi:hypothetical protein
MGLAKEIPTPENATPFTQTPHPTPLPYSSASCAASLRLARSIRTIRASVKLHIPWLDLDRLSVALVGLITIVAVWASVELHIPWLDLDRLSVALVGLITIVAVWASVELNISSLNLNSLGIALAGLVVVVAVWTSVELNIAGLHVDGGDFTCVHAVDVGEGCVVDFGALGASQSVGLG